MSKLRIRPNVAFVTGFAAVMLSMGACENPMRVPHGPAPAYLADAAARFGVPVATVEELDRKVTAMQQNASASPVSALVPGQAASEAEIRRLHETALALQKQMRVAVP